MIARVWKGWTRKDNADKYENLLRDTILPSFTEIKGYRGGTIFKEVGQDDNVEFIITNYFSSLDAIKAFAGQDDYTVAIIEPEARELLDKVESNVKHYEVREAFQLPELLK